MKFTGSELLTEVDVDGKTMENAYALVTGLFLDTSLGLIYSILYILGAIFLGLHLQHAFWSAFQTIGWSNSIWRNRLEVVGNIYALLIGCGFAIIPLYFLIFK
jgi:succinate dehydrogenase / fumarate reductase cytochrome b subunit